MDLGGLISCTERMPIARTLTFIIEVYSYPYAVLDLLRQIM